VQGLRFATAALESNGSIVAGGEELQERLVKVAGEWHFTLREITVSTNDLSPKEATQMSHDVKYIGMDVHKEVIVIVVLNESGK
jgi:hypothetical protein